MSQTNVGGMMSGTLLVIEDDLPRVRCDESPSLVEAWANAKRDEEAASG